ncbi:ExbD/TolR family protein [Endozoicomonas acroporae]|uniref:ExbD/TolR family protein n=1 Tax=Endozoicomonas TaxID=305899 RepID=UPI000C782320|nr:MULTISPECIES: biopolymer transporter ExbD [Endozoicomonas]WBA79674.1 biopolymer transporter ExbD [Endozoicomonas sp. GU-1]WBA87258.1 biopolymer transporter ExbD [Endozoicomonas sp. GU-1]
MRKFAWQQEEDQELNIDMTPMLDVVFILLIFFIVTASFIKETGIEVNRPQASTGKQQESAAILVALGADDTFWIDGRQVQSHSIRANIERLHSENPQGTLVIQADRMSRNEALITVMDAARAAGVENLAIATREAGS